MTMESDGDHLMINGEAIKGDGEGLKGKEQALTDDRGAIK